MKKIQKNDGKLFEQKIASLLKRVSKHHKASVMRLYDTHSAGNFIPAQMSDFVILTATGRAVALELKSSIDIPSLEGRKIRNFINPNQFSKMYAWNRCNGKVLVLFWKVGEDTAEVWEGVNVLKSYKENNSMHTCIGSLPVHDTKQNSDLLLAYMEL